MLARPNAIKIAEDLVREGPTLMPAHFEAEAYAGLRRLVSTTVLERDALSVAVSRIAGLRGERIPLVPLLPGAYRLHDNVGAHDAFYVVLAGARGAALLTSDRPLARAAERLGITVLFRPSEPIS